jgi:hypothetical protein
MLSEVTAPGQSLSLVAVMALGFFLGMRHATDADHVVAISTIVSRERRIGSAALVGAAWGVGHTLTILAVGVGIILFELVIPPRLGLGMEFSVGLMLIALGIVNLRSARSTAQHSALMVGRTHTHNSPNESIVVPPAKSISARQQVLRWVRPLAVGLVHGLAGSAAIALLILTTLHHTRQAVAYLGVFGLGTIAGMMAITMALASALRFAGERSDWINRRLTLATGILSVAFGMLIVYQMGFAHGLFLPHPTWTPE